MAEARGGDSEYGGGDFDYDHGGYAEGYARHRRADPRIAALVHGALGPAARTVLNVGAGTGSYEPEDRYVLAVEPSGAMRARRPARLAPAVRGVAEDLPLDDRSVDAAMALLTVHQWADAGRGLAELCRVSRGPVVVMTFDGDALDRYWLADYAPEVIATERRRFPPIDMIRAGLGGAGRETEVLAVPIPRDCTDGFGEAFYARPERLLDPAVRAAQSAWGFVGADVAARFEKVLGTDLASGEWDRRYGRWRGWPVYEGSLRLIVSRPGDRQHVP